MKKFLFILFPLFAIGQYTNNVSQNLNVSQSNNVNTLLKSVTGPSNGKVLSIYTNQNDELIAQVLDINGNPLFSPGGVVLDVDPNSTFFPPNNQVTINNLDAILNDNGSFVIAMTNGNEGYKCIAFNANGEYINEYVESSFGVTGGNSKPIIERSTHTNFFYVSYERSNYTVLEKYSFNPDNSIVMQWQNSLIDGHVGDIVPTFNDKVYLCSKFERGPNYKQYKVMLFDENGNESWCNWSKIDNNQVYLDPFNGPTVSHKIKGCVDYNHNLYVLVNKVDFTDSTCVLYKIDTNGTNLFGANGTNVIFRQDLLEMLENQIFMTSNINELMIINSVVFTTGLPFPNDISYNAIYQKVNTTNGSVQDITGTLIYPQSDSYEVLDSKLCTQDAVILSKNDNKLYLSKIDTNTGINSWNPNLLQINSTTNEKSQCQLLSNNVLLITVFSETRNGLNSVFAQNANCNGTVPLNKNKFTKNSFVIFPNPSQTHFTIKSNDNSIIKSVSLYDINGKNVLNIDKINQSQKTLNCDNLSAGTYTLEVVDQENEKLTFKIVITK